MTTPSTWAEHRRLEAEMIEAMRREWLRSIDHVTKADAARAAGMDRAVLDRLCKTLRHEWRTPRWARTLAVEDAPVVPQKPVVSQKPVVRTKQQMLAALYSSLTQEQRARVSRAEAHGVKRVYAIAEVLGAMA